MLFKQENISISNIYLKICDIYHMMQENLEHNIMESRIAVKITKQREGSVSKSLTWGPAVSNGN